MPTNNPLQIHPHPPPPTYLLERRVPPASRGAERGALPYVVQAHLPVLQPGHALAELAGVCVMGGCRAWGGGWWRPRSTRDACSVGIVSQEPPRPSSTTPRTIDAELGRPRVAQGMQQPSQAGGVLIGRHKRGLVVGGVAWCGYCVLST